MPRLPVTDAADPRKPGSRHLVAPAYRALADEFGTGRDVTIEGMRAATQAMAAARPPLPDDGVRIEERRAPARPARPTCVC